MVRVTSGEVAGLFLTHNPWRATMKAVTTVHGRSQYPNRYSVEQIEPHRIQATDRALWYLP